MRALSIEMMVTACALAWSLAPAAEPERPDGNQAAARIAEEVCSRCHGPAAQNASPLVPVIAGQQRSYLAWQLRAYKIGFRDDPQAHQRMWGQVAGADDSLIDSVAAYYASLPARAGIAADAASAAAGRRLYEGGAPAKDVTACSACHGTDAEGDGIFPRLAGQNAEYFIRQLSLIQDNLRNIGIMHSTVQKLSPAEMKDLAVYLQSK